MRDHRQELILGSARFFRLAPCLLGGGERLALGQPRARALSDVPSDLGRAWLPGSLLDLRSRRCSRARTTALRKSRACQRERRSLTAPRDLAVTTLKQTRRRLFRSDSARQPGTAARLWT